jgi:serine/threonine-protein kinase
MTDRLLSQQVLDGRYRIVRRIATGGMATVYLAEHVLIGRPVAIKVLHQQYAEDTECVTRFMAEGRTAGTLGHPHIVESTDMGYAAGGAPYLVLELLDGRTLHDAWVWDMYRPARFVTRVRVVTFKDVNIEELIRKEEL